MSIYEDLTPGDFAKSTKKRLPICFCLDTSGSMYAPTKSGRTRMDEVNAAFGEFITSIKKNPDVNAAADIAVITFGGKAEIAQKFMPVSSMQTPEIEAKSRSLTPIGEAILGAVALLEKRKEGYKTRGIKYYQPWLVVITDGEPEGKDAVANMNEAIEKVTELETQSKLVVFNIGIGDEANLDVLKRLSLKRAAPINLQFENIGGFFSFLGASSESVVNGDDMEDKIYGSAEDLPKGKEINISEWK